MQAENEYLVKNSYSTDKRRWANIYLHMKDPKIIRLTFDIFKKMLKLSKEG